MVGKPAVPWYHTVMAHPVPRPRAQRRREVDARSALILARVAPAGIGAVEHGVRLRLRVPGTRGPVEVTLGDEGGWTWTELGTERRAASAGALAEAVDAVRPITLTRPGRG